jgi:acetyl-CoA carboxylase carboxyl transferase subunit beta
MHIKLPEGTVNSEFVLRHGMIDAVVHRNQLRATLARLLRLYAPSTRTWAPQGMLTGSSVERG